MVVNLIAVKTLNKVETFPMWIGNGKYGLAVEAKQIVLHKRIG